MPTELPEQAEFDSVFRRLDHRRWHVMRSLIPDGLRSDTAPAWIETKDEFVCWLASRLTVHQLDRYFAGLENAAKQMCDLELLRIARANHSTRNQATGPRSRTRR